MGVGWYPIGSNPTYPMDTPERLGAAAGAIQHEASALGRDPASIEISVMGVPPDREAIEQYADAGADRIILGLESTDDEQDLPEMESTAEKVM